MTPAPTPEERAESQRRLGINTKTSDSFLTESEKFEQAAAARAATATAA